MQLISSRYQGSCPNGPIAGFQNSSRSIEVISIICKCGIQGLSLMSSWVRSWTMRIGSKLRHSRMTSRSTLALTIFLKSIRSTSLRGSWRARRCRIRNLLAWVRAKSNIRICLGMKYTQNDHLKTRRSATFVVRASAWRNKSIKWLRLRANRRAWMFGRIPGVTQTTKKGTWSTSARTKAAGRTCQIVLSACDQWTCSTLVWSISDSKASPSTTSSALELAWIWVWTSTWVDLVEVRYPWTAVAQAPQQTTSEAPWWCPPPWAWALVLVGSACRPLRLPEPWTNLHPS